MALHGTAAPSPAPAASSRALVDALGPRVRYRGPLNEVEGGFVSFRIAVPTDDAAWLRELRNDLQGRRLVDRYGAVWGESPIFAYTCSDLDTALFASILADAPLGTTVDLGAGGKLLGAWRLST
jgi:hypothetical protein